MQKKTYSISFIVIIIALMFFIIKHNKTNKVLSKNIPLTIITNTPANNIAKIDNTTSIDNDVTDELISKTSVSQIKSSESLKKADDDSGLDVEWKSYKNNPEFKEMKHFQKLVLSSPNELAKREAFFTNDKNLAKMEKLLNPLEKKDEINEYDNLLAIEFLAFGASIASEENKAKIEKIVQNYLLEYANIEDLTLTQKRLATANWLDIYTVAKKYFPKIADNMANNGIERVKELVAYNEKTPSFMKERINMFNKY